MQPADVDRTAQAVNPHTVGVGADAGGQGLDAGVAVGTPSTMPGALVEPLFITDPFEASIAASLHDQQVIAAGLARAIEQYFAPQPAPCRVRGFRGGHGSDPP
jgi:N-acetylmuramoyl-L-alanine amidase